MKCTFSFYQYGISQKVPFGFEVFCLLFIEFRKNFFLIEFQNNGIFVMSEKK